MTSPWMTATVPLMWGGAKVSFPSGPVLSFLETGDSPKVVIFQWNFKRFPQTFFLSQLT